MRTKRWIVGAVAVFSSISMPAGGTLGSAASGTVVDEGWLTSWPTGIGWQGVRFRDILEYNEAVSVLRGRPLASSGRWKGCADLAATACTSAEVVNFSSVLQPCSSPTQMDCIAEFGTVSSSGARVPGTNVGKFPSAGLNDFPADSAVGLPMGGPAGLWTLDESAGAPVRTHLVRAVVSGQFIPGVDKTVTFTNFAANVAPVEVKKFPCGSQPVEVVSGCRTGDLLDDPANQNGESGWFGYTYDYGSRSGFDCVLTGNLDVVAQKADCAERRSLSKDLQYFVSVRLSQAVSGWMHGRLAEPSIILDDIPGTNGGVSLTVAGRPVSVPSVVLYKKFAELPATLQEKYRSTGGWPRTGGGYWGASGGGSDNVDPTNPLLRNRLSLPSPYGVDSISELEAWMPVVNDSAIADVTTWTVRTLGSSNLGAAAGCVTDKNKVTGIVTTNATQYMAGAPTFDNATKTLSYTVSAPHYMSSGELFRGAYGLIIRSDVARCIYRFSSSPIKATIEVLDTGADKSTVTTNVSESNGWMRLVASGFTHSTPTIRAAFTQVEGPSTPTSSAAIKVGSTVTRAALLKRAALSITPRSRVTLSVSSASRQVCRLGGTRLRVTKKGTCKVTIVVQTGPRRISRTVRLMVN